MNYEKLFRFNLKLQRIQNNNDEMTLDGIRHPKIAENNVIIAEMKAMVNESCDEQIAKQKEMK